MLNQTIPESPDLRGSSKQESLKLYAPQIEQIKLTQNLGTDYMFAIVNRSMYEAERSGDNSVYLYEHFLRVADFPHFDFNRYPEISISSTGLLNTVEVQNYVFGSETIGLVMSLPQSLTFERDTALKMMSIFSEFLDKASTLSAIEDCTMQKKGLLREEITSAKGYARLEIDQVIQIEQLKGEVRRLEGQFSLHREIFTSGTMSKEPQPNELSSLDSISSPPNLRDLTQGH